MKVFFEITQASPDREWMQIHYTNEDGQEFYKNEIQVDWSADGVRSAVEAHGPSIVAYWERTKGVDVASTMEAIELKGEFECEPENFVVQIPEPPILREQPEYDPFTQRIEQQTHKYDDEFIEWEIIELTEEEKANFLQFAEDQVRGERNHRLVMSDFFNFPDACVANVQEWLDYRQELRDIPEQPSFPKKVIWPERPEVVKEDIE